MGNIFVTLQSERRLIQDQLPTGIILNQTRFALSFYFISVFIYLLVDYCKFSNAHLQEVPFERAGRGREMRVGLRLGLVMNRFDGKY